VGDRIPEFIKGVYIYNIRNKKLLKKAKYNWLMYFYMSCSMEGIGLMLGLVHIFEPSGFVLSSSYLHGASQFWELLIFARSMTLTLTVFMCLHDNSIHLISKLKILFITLLTLCTNLKHYLQNYSIYFTLVKITTHCKLHLLTFMSSNLAVLPVARLHQLASGSQWDLDVSAHQVKRWRSQHPISTLNWWYLHF